MLSSAGFAEGVKGRLGKFGDALADDSDGEAAPSSAAAETGGPEAAAALSDDAQSALSTLPPVRQVPSSASRSAT